jgi:hypothetical protein
MHKYYNNNNLLLSNHLHLFPSFWKKIAMNKIKIQFSLPIKLLLLLHHLPHDAPSLEFTSYDLWMKLMQSQDENWSCVINFTQHVESLYFLAGSYRDQAMRENFFSHTFFHVKALRNLFLSSYRSQFARTSSSVWSCLILQRTKLSHGIFNVERRKHLIKILFARLAKFFLFNKLYEMHMQVVVTPRVFNN